ncbi:S9 family peptidase [Aquimonas voraii]|uniref:Acyl-peptide hydrolase n=1 Tax=Aquimonas voraii TaxID=265719 RepID=A0A1G7AFQ3_9GAMM|nr:S9 family peptidase [Aquimonas voraii]SDE13758.1 Dipeptidyl aminopeptidase/acylaminoacyl peptidase [Aquimonas voraii]
MLRHLTCLGLLAAALPALADTATKQPFTIERSWEIQRLGTPTISPDGSRIVAPVTRFVMAEDRGYTDLWLWNADGSGERRFTTHTSGENAPVFSPDGRHIAFVAQREDDKAPQLYVMPIDGGEATRLTTLATGVQSPKWIGDGSKLAFVSRVFTDLPLAEQGKRLDERANSKMTARVFEGSVTAWDQYLDEREFHVFAVPAAGGEVQALTQPTGLSLPRASVMGTDGLFALSPDGAELAFVADSDPAPNRSNLDVFTVALGSEAATNHTADNPANDGSPAYSPDGRYLSYSQQRIKGFYADRMRLMLRERRSGDTRELYPDFDRSISGALWADNSKRLYASIDDAGTERVYELPLNGAPRALTGVESVGALALSTSGRLIGLRQTFIEPPTLVSIDPRRGGTTKLSTINDALLAATDFGTYESITYTGANGAEIQMWVNYPPGFDKTKKYPFFMLIHGGPHNAITNGMAFRWNAQVFSSWGYVTAWPNFHGSSGFGQEFADSINPNWADKPYEDVIKAAQWFAQQPWIDAERMVAGGGSYGGYLTSLILGREHPFRALVAHAAVYNLYTQYAADFAVEMPRFGGFWEEANREMIEKTSPHYHAANFKTPTLVVHGQTDLRVPVNHGQELYQTLLMKGVPTRYVYYPNENHWILKPQNSVFWYQQVKRWFEEHGGLGE